MERARSRCVLWPGSVRLRRVVNGETAANRPRIFEEPGELGAEVFASAIATEALDVGISLHFDPLLVLLILLQSTSLRERHRTEIQRSVMWAGATEFLFSFLVRKNVIEEARRHEKLSRRERDVEHAPTRIEEGDSSSSADEQSPEF
jgi:hypothetical protein